MSSQNAQEEIPLSSGCPHEVSGEYPPINQFANLEPWECNHCFVRNFTYLNLPKYICKNNFSKEAPPLEIVAAIVSSPWDFSLRNLLRETWLSATRGNTAANIRHVFLLGTAVSSNNNDKVQSMIDAESRIYNDIIQSSFQDTYRNLTLKTLMMLDWSLEYCYNAKFIFKVDIDVFTHIPALLNITKQIPYNTSVFGEFRPLRGQYPIRTAEGPSSKWQVSIEEYPRPFYPPFPAGPRYLIPMAMVPDLLKVSPNTPFFPLEDVYMGLLLEKTPYSVTNVRPMINKGALPTDCQEARKITTMHVTENIWALFKTWQQCFEHS